MDFEELKAALEGHEKAAEIIEFVNASIEQERSLGMSKKRAADAEAKKFREFKIAFEKLGYKAGDDLAEFVENLSAGTGGQTADLVELNKSLKKLQRDFEESQSLLQNERESAEQLRRLNKVKTIESALGPVLKEEFFASNHILDNLISKGVVDVDETGEIVFKKSEDEVLTKDKGLEWLREANSESRKIKQAHGGGTSSLTSKTGDMTKPTFTLDQIKKMSEAEVKQNLPAINESIRLMGGKQT